MKDFTRMSISGFHDPAKHKGLTPEEFMVAYVVAQLKKLSKKKNSGLDSIVDVVNNWKTAEEFSARRFRTTLNTTGQNLTKKMF